VDPTLPRQLDDVIHHAMAKDPNDRYLSAGDLGRAAKLALETHDRRSRVHLVLIRSWP
jgi:serine/threonine-protein kinase